MDFPAFTVCSAGFANQNLAAGFYKEYLNFLKEHDAGVNATPYHIASIFERYFEVLYKSFLYYKHVSPLEYFFWNFVFGYLGDINETNHILIW